ncbi:MAG: response regulator [Fibrobacterota bacterium]|nr:response regulator [Fibrobacterota bacterium]QQS07448.1 MAG: response regulator [Fibrobacterota bacterium]
MKTLLQDWNEREGSPSKGSLFWRAWLVPALVLGWLLSLGVVVWFLIPGQSRWTMQESIGSKIGRPLAAQLHHQSENMAGQPDLTGALAILVVGLLGALLWQFVRGRARLRMSLEERTRDLVESEERYRRVFQAGTEGMVIARSDTLVIVDANEEAASMLGYTAAGLRLFKLDDLRPDGEAFAPLLERIAKERGRRMTTGMRAKGGHVLKMELSVVSITWEGSAHLLLAFHDVSERMKFEETIQKLSTALEQSPMAMVITDRDSRIEYVNPAFTQTTGYGLGELLGQNPSILQSGQTPWKVYEDLWATLHAGRVWRGEFINRKKNGEVFWEQATIAPIRQQGGKFGGYVAIKEDVTEKRASEEKLKLAMTLAENANVAKSEFLANMSHEIRTPMNGVIGMTSLLLETDLTKEQRRFAEIVRTSSESLLSLINDILDFSKIEAGKLELDSIDFDLGSLFDDLAPMLAHRADGKGLEFLSSISSAIPVHLKGDPGRLRQILLNLGSNAVKFAASGEVAVQASLVSEDPESVSIRFSIRDSGIGIPPEKQNLLFQKFSQVDASVTRHFGGTGLGLAISKELVEKMEGEIGVNSPWSSPIDGEEHLGSEFWFTARFEKQKEQRSRPVLPSEIRGARILVVDDNETNRLILLEQIHSWQGRPWAVPGGAEAITELRSAIEAKDPYQLVVVDMKMEVMDGIAFAHLVKADHALRSVPLVLMTSMANRGDGKRMQRAGFSGYLPKPAKQTDLLDIISFVLGTSSRSEDMPMITRHTVRELRRSTARILMAEDNHTNQILALEVLKKLGVRADMVSNGELALRALESTPYDLVLMDMQMPEMDGVTATRSIRDPASAVLDRNIPVIAMTANAMNGDRERCLAAGMNDYLSKPFTPQSLVAILDRWLPKEKIFQRDASSEVDETETVSSQTEIPVFHRKELIARVLGDLEFARTVASAFREDVLRLLQELGRAMEAEDCSIAYRVVHTIHGAASGVGGRAMSAFAAELEGAAHRQDLAALRKGETGLSDHFHRLVEAMENEL